MKKIKIIGLSLLALFVILSVFSTNLNTNSIQTEKNIQSTDVNEVNEIDEFRRPKKSWFNNSMDPIHINGYDPNSNWSWALDQDWCHLGDGSRSNPYIIENITIDAGGSGSGILIENSINIYFKIKNCTVYNSGTEDDDAGIKLNNTNNGEINNNTCSLNNNGILLIDSNNNTILNNTANNNSGAGIFLKFSDNNTISGNTANNNGVVGISLEISSENIISGSTANKNIYGISVFRDSSNNTVSGNTANNNSFGIIIAWNSPNNTVLENIVNNNEYGIYIGFYSNNNTVLKNTIIHSIHGIFLRGSHNNTISGNTVFDSVFFIFENRLDLNNKIENNILYTEILPTGINEIEIDPYEVEDIDVNMSIALKNTTKVLYSAFNNNTSKVPLDNGLIFLDLELNESDNLNQNLDAPINITFKYDVRKYKTINIFWFNKSINGKEGIWEEIPFTDLGNGIIIFSVNHTSLFALKGELKTFPLFIGEDDDNEINDEINILLIIIIAIIIGLVSSIAASSTYYYKMRSDTIAKPTKKEIHMKKLLVKSFDEKDINSVNLKEYIDDKILLNILQEENGLEKIASLGDLNITTISPDFWEKIDLCEWNKTERKDFTREMLSLPPKERQEIFNDILRKENNRNSSIRSTEIISEKINLKEHIDDKILLKILQEENGLAMIASLGDLNITTLSPDFWEKTDLFDWNETEREDFIREMLSLPPRERQEILSDILKKSMTVRKK